MFLGKGALEICSKVTGEHSCQSAISIKLQSNFIEIALWHGCSPVNLLHIFRVPFPKNTSGRLLLKILFKKSGSGFLLLIILLAYSVRMRENAGKMRNRITPNTDSFYVVILWHVFLNMNWFADIFTDSAKLKKKFFLTHGKC